MARSRFLTLTPTQLADEFAAIAHDASTTFGALGEVSLNWKPDATSWSVGQCVEHLLKADQEMRQAIARALDPSVTPTIWQRLPLWPRLFGWLLVSSQSPGTSRKYQAPSQAQPTASAVPADIVARLVERQSLTIAGVKRLTPADGARVMVSPFARQITYTVLDAYRLMAAHQRRHLEQAARVAAHPDFPHNP